MAQRHSTPIRGLIAAKHSPLFQGRFGRLFRSLPPAKFGVTETDNLNNLAALGAKMSATFDPPTDGKDPEESGIPALYTYLGQFVDHDITFDPASSLQMQDDPDALTDFRTPAFDLDNIYGRGPDDQPYMYDGACGFLLGTPLTGGTPGATDLPRNAADPARALIGDPRNDENTIVSQLQGLFHRFHNRTLKENSALPFEQIQKLVRFHYQWVLLNDFLPRIVNADVLKALKNDKGVYEKDKLKFFHWKNEPFMPVEFSVACYRLGHSMIRPGYRLNNEPSTLLPIFATPDAVKAGFKDDLQGFRALTGDRANRAIDWGRFIDIDTRVYDGSDADNKNRLQFAYRIDTSVVNPLSNLPPPVAANPPSLAQRNLERAWRLGLPTGQHVAHAMGVTPMADKDILIGKGVDKQDPADPPIVSIDTVAPVFKKNCPLWTYILAEAMHHQTTVKIPVKEGISITTPQLGPVGGRIVAEVFLGLMFGDNHSQLVMEPTWKPEKTPYALKDFVNFALSK
jgi:Animal haem peroxidase